MPLKAGLEREGAKKQQEKSNSAWKMTTQGSDERQNQDNMPVRTQTDILHHSPKSYIGKWKLHILSIGLWIALFLSTVETTIVSTSLVSVTNALNGFDKRDWIVTAYLLTYTGFLTIYAKLGDVFGRKTMFIVGIGSFILFSILCGMSTKIEELIVFRAFQGFGASGIYSMTIAIAPTLVPPQKAGKYIALVSTVFALASVVGPLIGGAISQSARWQWIFLFNAPAGVLALIIIIALLPSSSSGEKISLISKARQKVSAANLRRIDVLGVILLLGASILLVFAFESAGTKYTWNSGIVISTLIVGITLFAGFIVWEWWLQHKQPAREEPVFPPRILQQRVMAAMFLTSFFVGFPFTSVVVNIPQKSQAVYGYGSQHAGITLLPLLLSSPFATMASGYLTSNAKVPPVYLILAGAVIQMAGMGMTCSLPTDFLEFPRQQYAFEAITGIGFGLMLSTILTLAPIVADNDVLPVTMGALTQVRVLGGTLGLSISATVLNSYVSDELESLIGLEKLQAITDSFSTIDSLSSVQQRLVRVAFAKGFYKQNILLAAFSGMALICSLFLWEKPARKVADMEAVSE